MSSTSLFPCQRFKLWYDVIMANNSNPNGATWTEPVYSTATQLPRTTFRGDRFAIKRQNDTLLALLYSRWVRVERQFDGKLVEVYK